MRAGVLLPLPPGSIKGPFGVRGSPRVVAALAFSGPTLRNPPFRFARPLIFEVRPCPLNPYFWPPQPWRPS